MFEGKTQKHQYLPHSFDASELTVITQVYTNLGRTVELPPPEDSEWDMNTRAEDEGELTSVKPDTGKVVGFLARAVSLAATFACKDII